MAPRSVVVAGAGQAGLETAAALRARGYPGRVTLVGDEPPGPVHRPPLSKGYLTGAVSAEDVPLRPAAFYSGQDIELLTGDVVASVDRERHTVLLESGLRLPYGALVLATGCRPRPLPVPGASLAGVRTLRGLADAEALRQRLHGTPVRLVVIGAGFIGLEVAATARGLGHDVTVVEAQPRALARALTPLVSDRIVAEHRAHGVRVLMDRQVAALHGEGTDEGESAGAGGGRVRAVELADGERIDADLVVVGIGVLPDTGLALAAGLAVDDGVVVDEGLRTADPGIWAVGDCAAFPSVHAGRRIRLESVQNATDQARCVAAAICGEPRPYTAVPRFWTDQYAMRIQTAGLTSGHDETVTSGDPDGDRFSVFCFRAGRLTGVESVNRPADHGIAARLLAAGTRLTPAEVRAPGFDLKKLPRTPQTPPAPSAPPTPTASPSGSASEERLSVHA
ncbi:FAD-dependent oxidoreductase [Streptomyces sp. NPDC047000]|uniref:NAD(P)/FAD-dependent oxidoreductase n=1 Tax=Streptomyces sp. NPDC047000 TaxID=3155474 RepID=UPI0033FFCDF2